MDEKDQKIQRLIAEVARWKGRALEAVGKACIECEIFSAENPTCKRCRMTKIREEAEK